jgi:hypothetical protein
MTAYPEPNLDHAGLIDPMGLPITAGCDTAWNQTRVCSDASSSALDDVIQHGIKPGSVVTPLAVP